VAENRVTRGIVVHGGAEEIVPEQEDANWRGCLEAVSAGQAILAQGGSVVDAVEATIRILESDPAFNAGYGSALNAAGELKMDAMAAPLVRLRQNEEIN
jgi:beta-aspartyl-peptidase (threonine type)